ncbi:MAG: recombination regulator RecX [Eubacterium sp.]|nr:recombination regulator RecX [Eubacterium sp.]
MNVLKVLKKEKSYYIYLEDYFLGILYYKDFSKLGLKAENSSEFYIEDVSDEKIELLKNEVVSKGFNKAVTIATARECSGSIIREKLKLKKFPEYAIEDVVELMYSYNYLNDERFVESYVRSYMLSKSRRMIEKELEDRKIDVSLYQEVISGVYRDEGLEESDTIEKLLDKKFRGQDMSDEKVRRRAYSYLMRHGFGYDKIKLYLT